MAKELMEIGGFITEGAEIVNHDNTLSGNGTVDSPLGVVPGYNETVLWEGDAVSGITLSETALNFDHLKVKFRTNDNISFEDTVFVEQKEQFTLMGKYFWIGGNTAYLKISTFEMNAARTTINVLGGADLGFGTNYVIGIGNKLYIQRVIGVNRKA